MINNKIKINNKFKMNNISKLFFLTLVPLLFSSSRITVTHKSSVVLSTYLNRISHLHMFCYTPDPELSSSWMILGVIQLVCVLSHRKRIWSAEHDVFQECWNKTCTLSLRLHHIISYTTSIYIYICVAFLSLICYHISSIRTDTPLPRSVVLIMFIL